MKHSFTKQQIDINDLIRRIYKAAIEPEEWHELLTIMGDGFRSHLGCNVEQFVDSGKGNDFTYAIGYTKESYDLYAEYYGPRCLLFDELTQCKAGSLFVDHQAANYQAHLSSESYIDYHLKMDGAHVFALFKEFNEQTISYTAFRRSAKQGAYTDEELNVANILLPHFIQASQISREFELKHSLNRSYEEAFNQLSVAIVLIKSPDHVLFINHAAEHLLSHSNSFSLRNKQFKASNSNDNTTLQTAIQQVFAMSRGDSVLANTACVIQRDGGLRPYQLSLMPIIQEVLVSNESDELALVVISDPEQHVINNEHMIAALYQLTPTEAKVVQAFCNGLSTAEIASSYNLSANTVRFHTKNIFQKLHVKRQSDVARLVLSGPLGQLQGFS